MTLLALDTSTALCSVALLKNGRIEGELRRTVRTGHAGILLKLIDSLLDLCACSKDTIDMIAVGRGPGSFTGIRIGIATAKGLATALGCELKGVCTLDALAYGARPCATPIMPVLDARKGEIFCALYAPDGARMGDYLNIPPERIADYIDQPTLLVGNGLELYGDTLTTALGPRFHPGPQTLWHPQAALIGALALRHPEELNDLNPLYVRASDATLSLKR